MAKIRVKYRRARFTVEARKPLTCECCGRYGRLECHHWCYEYPTQDVRENVQLALDNTSWLCFRCHMVADALRAWFDVPVEARERMLRVRFDALGGLESRQKARQKAGHGRE